MPPDNELTLQTASNKEFYLSLYIKEGEERSSIKNFFSAEIVKEICNLNNDGITKRLQKIWARVGQGTYRDEMLKMWHNACSVTGCSIKETLIASHVKPWKLSDDFEKIDYHNGLLLSANLDALFDKGLMTFDKEWKICFPLEKLEELKKLGITENMHIRKDSLSPEDQQQIEKFLEYHRKNIYKGKLDCEISNKKCVALIK